MKEFDELLEIMHRLRQECPWDKEQDLKSLRKYLLEEAYECVGAIDDLENSPSFDPLTEELGDVLLQVIFQAELLSEETKTLAMKDIIQKLSEKLIRRHPHVFGEPHQKTSDTATVLKKWDEIKKSEKGSHPNTSHLDGISKSHTALQRAQKLGDRSKKVQFDWADVGGVWTQFESEIEELRQAKTTQEKEHEIGDIFFSLVQLARHLGLDSEVSLAQANRRFESRFRQMEQLATARGRDFASLSLEEKESLWKEVKQKSGSTKF